ncbi:TetR/AcrR family transcriptional regulator [Streptomonospora wellingtoniae]|uniref:Helix-turn-helix domain-containing protein n=1 Tax=Streptomonospora wellingtoniae TaxID=3075544 RepID=A0ABU2KNP0_9ACTN|nr:helix-turn-helix domain-containing protein [Streptomonospora sp. DSM 45055]MDT0300884.1 helix-turn-helix domain-containing protein [Streptomonospora sp. DSM 45055]
MNSSFEQNPPARTRSAETRRRLLTAAAALIAEVGWGRVTTRAVAERAGLPLGAVSYHFRGKRELLAEAALETVEAAFPIGELAAVTTLSQLIELITAAVARRGDAERVLSGVLVETLREAGRDPELTERVTALLAEYRRLLSGLVRAEQERGAVRADADPDAVAALLAASGDGLVLHGLLDPATDTVGAFATLRALLET